MRTLTCWLLHEGTELETWEVPTPEETDGYVQTVRRLKWCAQCGRRLKVVLQQDEDVLHLLILSAGAMLVTGIVIGIPFGMALVR